MLKSRSGLWSWLLGAALGVALAPTSWANQPVRINAAGDGFVDADGQAVILRGFNVTGRAKVPDFRPLKGPEDFLPMKDLGVNVTRLLFIWEAYEPVRGQFDESYLTYFLDQMRWLRDLGIYVIVDFHQDGYSRFANGGCGEGFPRWTIPSWYKIDEPRNDQHCKYWFFKLLAPQNTQLFEDFIANKQGFRDDFFAMVRRVALAVKGQPNLIGFDLLNEPWARKLSLKSFYEAEARVIQAVIPDTLIFAAPSAIGSTGVLLYKMEPMNLKNFVYAPHFYDASVNPFGRYLGVDPAVFLRKFVAHGRLLKAPVFLGEFGSPATTVDVELYMERLYQAMDILHMSGAQWEYNPTWSPDDFDGWNTEDFSILDDQLQLRANAAPRIWLESFPKTVEIIKGWGREQSLVLRISAVGKGQIGRIVLRHPTSSAVTVTGKNDQVLDGLDCNSQETSTVCSYEFSQQTEVIFHAVP